MTGGSGGQGLGGAAGAEPPPYGCTVGDARRGRPRQALSRSESDAKRQFAPKGQTARGRPYGTVGNGLDRSAFVTRRGAMWASRPTTALWTARVAVIAAPDQVRGDARNLPYGQQRRASPTVLP